MGEPITVGGGGGLIRTLIDYNLELRFDDTKFVRNADGDFVYAGYKIGVLKMQNLGGSTTYLDCTPLLPSDGVCTIVLKFKHGYERIYIQNKPVTIIFDEGLWRTGGAGTKLWTRNTQHDRMTVDLGRGRWKELDVGSPGDDFLIRVEAVPI
jgi:hypothetical protein